MPETSKIEEVILMLNPLYTTKVESCEKLLERMKFKILAKKVVNLTQ